MRLHEDILADAFVYLRRVELISSVYLVSHLFHYVAHNHASVRSVLRLDRIVTRRKVTPVDDERLSNEKEEEGSGALFIYARHNVGSYSVAIRSPVEVPSYLRFDRAFINHHDLAPITQVILRQLESAFVHKCQLFYDWYRSITNEGVVGNSPSSVHTPNTSSSSLISYNEMSTLFLNHLGHVVELCVYVKLPARSAFT